MLIRLIRWGWLVCVMGLGLGLGLSLSLGWGLVVCWNNVRTLKALSPMNRSICTLFGMCVWTVVDGRRE